MTTTTENIRTWATTKAGNASADAAITSADTQSPDTVDDNIRSIMASVRRESDDRGGAIVAGGTATALTGTTASGLTLAHVQTNGFRICVRTASASTGAATINFDGGGAVTIKKNDGSAIVSGDWSSGAILELVYSSTATALIASNLTAIPTAQIAVQADQETATSTTLAVTPGRQQYHPSAAKCWAVVTVSGGVPTLQTSYNITSITDGGVGILTVTIATDFSTANWACVATAQDAVNGSAVRLSAKAAGTTTLKNNDLGSPTSPSDPDAWSMIGFGDQA